MAEIEKKEIKEQKETKEQPKAPQLAKSKPIQEILLHIKPARLLTLLLQEKQWSMAALARESSQSYVYATELVKIFEKEALITVTAAGKRRAIKLTEKGEKAAKLILELIQLPSEEQQKAQKPALQ